jgi:hypothetical protein
MYARALVPSVPHISYEHVIILIHSPAPSYDGLSTHSSLSCTHAHTIHTHTLSLSHSLSLSLSHSLSHSLTHLHTRCLPYFHNRDSTSHAHSCKRSQSTSLTTPSLLYTHSTLTSSLQHSSISQLILTQSSAHPQSHTATHPGPHSLSRPSFTRRSHVGNQSRPEIFDLEICRPDLLYERVIEVDERVMLVRKGQEIPDHLQSLRAVPTNSGDTVHVLRAPDLSRLTEQLKVSRCVGAVVCVYVCVCFHLKCI